jgi:hypothetical protein
MSVYWPNGELTRPHVTSDYNPARRNPVTGVVQPHNGIDLIGWEDNKSPVDGTVLFAGYNGPAGNEVRIRADGPTAFHVGDCYRILHNARLYVRTGQRVSARQPVGRMGTTGQSTGVHCHYETHEGGLWRPVNPTNYMNRANAGSPAGGGATPLPEDDDMPLTDDERSALFQIRDELRELLPGREGVRPQGATNKVLIETLLNSRQGTAAAVAAAVWGFPVHRSVDGAKVQVAAIQELADAKTNTLALLGRSAGEVDEGELAAALAPALAPMLAENLGTLSDETINTLVERLLDEQAKRLAA